MLLNVCIKVAASEVSQLKQRRSTHTLDVAPHFGCRHSRVGKNRKNGAEQVSLPLLQHYLATSVFRGMIVFKFFGGRNLPTRTFGVLQSYFQDKICVQPEGSDLELD
jgi:hypothetical protein